MPSKYQPLVDHLIARTDAAEVTLTFDKIEAVIGDTLPVATRIETGLWNGAHLAYLAYVRAWQAAGWIAALDRRNRRVVFARDAEGAADAGW